MSNHESEIFQLVRGRTPLIVSMPHVGTQVPEAVEREFTPVARALTDTDWHVDRLYDFVPELGAVVDVTVDLPRITPRVAVRVACQRIDAASCLVIEDSVAGVVAARAAGMIVFAFVGASHFSPVDDGADLTAAGAELLFDDMARLPDLVAARAVRADAQNAG